MCGNTTCPLAWREKLNLRQLCDDLSDHRANNLLAFQIAPGLLIYDVCTALGLDPYDILPADVVCDIRAMETVRLWPVLSEAEDAEMVDLENIRHDEIPLPEWPEHFASDDGWILWDKMEAWAGAS